MITTWVTTKLHETEMNLQFVASPGRDAKTLVQKYHGAGKNQRNDCPTWGQLANENYLGKQRFYWLPALRKPYVTSRKTANLMNRNKNKIKYFCNSWW